MHEPKTTHYWFVKMIDIWWYPQCKQKVKQLVGSTLKIKKLTFVWKSTWSEAALYSVSTTCLKEGFKESDLSTQTPLANDNRGPPAALPSAKTRSTSWEERELSSSVLFDLRKDSNWSRVWPLEPAAIKLRTTWMERGEKTTLESLPWLNRTCFARVNETSVWLLIDWRRSISRVCRGFCSVGIEGIRVRFSRI